MLKYKFTKQALRFLRKIPAKHASQIVSKIDKLASDPESVPTIQLEGFPHLRRGKSGEYRFIFQFKEGFVTVFVLKIGKRNDGEVYENLENLRSENEEITD
jgi:mRNA interferase RelE/StbE